jgi:hypothetical protein
MSFIQSLIVLSCLLIPLLYYVFLQEYFEDLRAFQLMSISSSEYFSYTFPACIFFNLGLNIYTRETNPNFYTNTKVLFSNNKIFPVLLLLFGVASGLISNYVPISFRYIFQIQENFIYSALLISFLSKYKYRYLIIYFVIMYTFLNIIKTGMYTKLISMSIVFVLLIFPKYKVSLIKKLFIIFVSIIFILFLQSIKTQYRVEVWDESVRNSSVEKYIDIAKSNLADYDLVTNPIAYYGLLQRFNQGVYISNVIFYVPYYFDYGYGFNLIESVFASFIPRFIWKNKPIAGGSYNVSRFLGDDKYINADHSYNLGIIGEAYAHFGSIYSLIYLFFIGFIVRFSFKFFLKKIILNPIYIIFAPIFLSNFYLIVETDLLTFINGITKTFLFIILSHYFFKKLSLYNI